MERERKRRLCVYMWETWVAAHPILKIAANTLYDTVSNVNESLWKIVHGKQPPKTEENEIATSKDPAACQILKCPNLSICVMSKKRCEIIIYIVSSSFKHYHRNDIGLKRVWSKFLVWLENSRSKNYKLPIHQRRQ